MSAGAHAQSSVSLYGLIDTGIVYVNNAGGHSNWLQSGSSTQNTVFGLKGTEDLGGGLHALFRLEQGFNLNNGSEAFAGSMFGSQAWVGLEHERYGTLTLGRQFDVFNDTVGPLTSGYNTWGGSITAHPFDNDNLAGDSVVPNNVVKYVSPTLYGATIEAMYGFSNKSAFADNRTYGFGVTYALGAVNLAAGYLQFDNAGGGNSQTNPNGSVSLGDGSANVIAKRQRIWGAGGSYTFGAATVGLVWSHTQIDSLDSLLSLGSGDYIPLGGALRLNNYEANARYAITPAWSVSAAYTFTDGTYSDAATGGGSPKWHTAMLQTDYMLSKRTDLYLEGAYQRAYGAPVGSPLGHAMLNTLSPSSTGSQVAVLAGLRHQF